MKEKKEIYDINLEEFREIARVVPLNSEFDDSLKASDLRMVKTIYLDESNEDEDWVDHFYDDLLEELGHDEVFDLQCLTGRINRDEPEWESIIAYPKYASGSKTRNKYHRIQRQLERHFRKKKPIKTMEE